MKMRGFDIDAIHGVEVVAAVGFRQIPVGVVELPLSAPGARVITRRRRRVHAKLRHQPADHVVVMKISTDAELRQLELAGPKISLEPTIVSSRGLLKL